MFTTNKNLRALLLVSLLLLATLTLSGPQPEIAQAQALSANQPPPFETPPSRRAFGSYICPTTHNGLLTVAAQFTIRPHGRFIEHTTGQKTAWRYTGQREFIFPKSPDIHRAIFMPNREQFRLFLRNDSHRPHGRGQQLVCHKLQEQTQREFAPTHLPDPQTLATATAKPRIAFTSYRSTSGEIHLMDPDGNNIVQITGHGLNPNSNPTWSPDGSQIIYQGNHDFSGENLYRIDANGSNVVQLTSGISAGGAKWAPNGDHIAFAGSANGSSDIYIIDPDGNDMTQLTNTTAIEHSPDWSINNKQLVFISNQDGDQEVYTMNRDGSDIQQLTFNTDRETGPAWSPDNKKIAFSSDRNGVSDIYVMDKDGSNVTQLTFNQTAHSPTWSPDGSQLLFVALKNGYNSIYVMDSDGSNQVQLTDDPFGDFSPEWSTQDVYVQNVLHIIYDPYLPQRDRNLSSYYLDPQLNAYEAPVSFKQHTDNRVKFVIQDEIIVDDFTPRSDGFKHNEETFFDCRDSGWPNTTECSGSIVAAYNDIITDPAYDICGRLNRGEIDEVWLNTPPYGGFYESVLVGPAGFPYNGPTFTSNDCDSLIPIMVLVYDRYWDGGHTFGHRVEATMTRIHGRWQQDVPDPNPWELFSLVRWMSPNSNFASCGNVHFPPNSTEAADEYDYGTTTIPFDSICDDFPNYPSLGNPHVVKTAVTCTDWNCNEHGYYNWWFSHLPTIPGSDSEGKMSDWWPYILDPNLAHASPQVDFSLDIQSGPAPLTVSFSPTVTGLHDTFSWDFGDSNSSNTATPTHTFTSEGVYSVTLTVDGPYGSDSITHYVSVMGATAYPGLIGSYYDYEGPYYTPADNPFENGTLKFQRVDSSIQFSWSTGSPNTELLGNDHYAVRWEGLVRAPLSGEVTFRTHSDDGTRLRISDVDNATWLICGACYNYVTIEMEGGQWYPIVLEYFEDHGAAQIQLDWLLPGSTTYEPLPNAHLFASTKIQPGLWGTYFDHSWPLHSAPDDPFSNGIEKFTRSDSMIDFRWELGSPNEAALGNNQFAIQWDGWVRGPVTGEVAFRVHSDDGSRLQIGDSASELWINCGACQNILTVDMEADAWLPLHIDYYEDIGGAQVQLEWKLPGESGFTAVPQPHLVTHTDNCILPNGPQISASLNGDDFDLTLQNGSGTDEFYLYASVNPYETPFMYAQKVDATEFTDDVGLFDSYFYYATEANGRVCQSVPSNRVGVFRFDVTVGE
ncbi:MAG: PA14 domain-containing protein [Chloroflexota bacterium]